MLGLRPPPDEFGDAPNSSPYEPAAIILIGDAGSCDEGFSSYELSSPCATSASTQVLVSCCVAPESTNFVAPSPLSVAESMRTGNLPPARSVFVLLIRARESDREPRGVSSPPT